MYESDVASALRMLETSGVACDVCFLDPPYAMRGAFVRTLDFLGESKIVGPSTIVVVEHGKKFDPGEKFGSLSRVSNAHARRCGTEFVSDSE